MSFLAAYSCITLTCSAQAQLTSVQSCSTLPKANSKVHHSRDSVPCNTAQAQASNSKALPWCKTGPKMRVLDLPDCGLHLHAAGNAAVSFCCQLHAAADLLLPAAFGKPCICCTAASMCASCNHLLCVSSVSAACCALQQNHSSIPKQDCRHAHTCGCVASVCRHMQGSAEIMLHLAAQPQQHRVLLQVQQPPSQRLLLLLLGPLQSGPPACHKPHHT